MAVRAVWTMRTMSTSTAAWLGRYQAYRVCGVTSDETEHGGAPACMRMEGGFAFGGDAGGCCCALLVKAEVEETAPGW